MKFKIHTLAAALLGLQLALPAQAGGTTAVSYASLGGTPITFASLATGVLDEVVVDGLLSLGGVQFGERFAGQELAVAKAPRPGVVAQDWFDDLSFGAPTAGLTLLAGAAGANLGAFHYDDADGTALAGLGPQNSDGSSPFGFGAISGLFASPVSALGFQLRDSDGGSITLRLYKQDGSLIEAVDLTGNPDGRYAWMRVGGTADIAGFTLTNRDTYYGVSIDNLVTAAAPVPEPGSYALLLAGLGAIAGLRRRRFNALS